MRTVRIGCGSGYLEDRLDPALEIIERGDVQYVVFETLAEATLAGMHLEKQRDPGAGYARLTAERMRQVLPLCAAKGVKLVSSMGCANPQAARDHVVRVARELGLSLRVAIVLGDDLLGLIPRLREGGSDLAHLETGAAFETVSDRLVSANAYLGAEPIAEALRRGADVVITGRVTDSALYLGPLLHAFDWPVDDWDRLASGVIVGHLLECAGHITGGNYHGPEWREIDYAHLGHGIAEVNADGGAIITKVAEAGGIVNRRTCIEQLLYETHDPGRFMSPDVIADFTAADFVEEGKDRVRLSGVRGLPRPDTLKALIGYHDGFIAEGQATYGWPDALAKAKRAAAVVEERLRMQHFQGEEILAHYIGVNSMHGPLSPDADPFEVRLRFAAKARERAEAEKVVLEMATLYDGGPQGAAGILGATAATQTLLRPVLAIWPTLVPRKAVVPNVLYEQT
jgi:hypothetical protein